MQVMWLLNGAGSNGKSLMIDTIKYIAGAMWMKLPPGLLLSRDARFNNPENASPGVARLRGARAAVSSEIKGGRALDANFIKQHTGEREIAARALHQNTTEFAVTHKLLLQSNAIPKLDELDGAIRGRVLMIPFDRKWNRPGETPDPRLPDGDAGRAAALLEEAPGILAWIVRGAVDFHAHGLGLGQCSEVQAATGRYFDRLDVLGRWMRERTVRCSPAEGLPAAELLVDLESWCAWQDHEDVKLPALNSKGLSAALNRAGFPSHRYADRGRVFGLRISGGPLPMPNAGAIFKGGRSILLGHLPLVADGGVCATRSPISYRAAPP